MTYRDIEDLKMPHSDIRMVHAYKQPNPNVNFCVLKTSIDNFVSKLLIFNLPKLNKCR